MTEHFSSTLVALGFLHSQTKEEKRKGHSIYLWSSFLVWHSSLASTASAGYACCRGTWVALTNQEWTCSCCQSPGATDINAKWTPNWMDAELKGSKSLGVWGQSELQGETFPPGKTKPITGTMALTVQTWAPPVQICSTYRKARHGHTHLSLQSWGLREELGASLELADELA